jgi:hypothetical protein
MARELKEVRRLIGAVLSDPRLEDGQRDQLNRLMRELEQLGRRGKIKRRDVVRPFRQIALLLNEVLKL